MAERERVFIDDLAERRVVGNHYRDSEGRSYCVLEVRENENYVLADVGGTERPFVLCRCLRHIRVR